MKNRFYYQVDEYIFQTQHGEGQVQVTKFRAANLPAQRKKALEHYWDRRKTLNTLVEQGIVHHYSIDLHFVDAGIVTTDTTEHKSGFSTHSYYTLMGGSIADSLHALGKEWDMMCEYHYDEAYNSHLDLYRNLVLHN